MTERRRKIEKILVFVVVPVLIVVLLCHCCVSLNKVRSYEFMSDPAEITSIEIVVLGEYDKDIGHFEENVISVIEDHETFLNEFRALECRQHFMDPLGVSEGSTVIKLTYSNGSYELISGLGIGKYVKYEDGSGKLFPYSGYQTFDEKFPELIEKYS